MVPTWTNKCFPLPGYFCAKTDDTVHIYVHILPLNSILVSCVLILYQLIHMMSNHYSPFILHIYNSNWSYIFTVRKF